MVEPEPSKLLTRVRFPSPAPLSRTPQGVFLQEAGMTEPERETEAGAERPRIEGAVGLGVDIVEIERMAAILERTKSFARRVFSENERAYCDSKANPAAHYATRFAAKEAVRR